MYIYLFLKVQVDCKRGNGSRAGITANNFAVIV